MTSVDYEKEKYTDEILKIYTANDMRVIIRDHLSSMGKKLTNLNTTPVKKLKEFIYKYDIPFDEEYHKRIVDEKAERKAKLKKENDDIVNPFKIGFYTYDEPVDADGDKWISTKCIEITKVTAKTVSYTLYRRGFNDENPRTMQVRKNIKVQKCYNEDYAVSFGQYYGGFTYKGLTSHAGKTK